MPRSTKEAINLEENTQKKKATSSKKTTAKTTRKSNNTSKSVQKKVASTVVKQKTTKKVATTKNVTAKKSVNGKKEKTTSSKKRTSNTLIEYYDLPYRYNKTVVKILAQTPNKLFVYWDVSDRDRKSFIETYGNNFFEITKPVLIIRNTTMNYSFEVDINDFANSWYLNINHSNCKYSIELGRKPIYNNSDINSDYIYIYSSNNIEAPNDHILFDNNQNMVYFRNVKTNMTTAKHITSLSFLTNMGRIYNIYDLYKKIYANEDLDDFNNPSSSFMK